MVIKPATLDAAFLNYSTRFQEVFTATEAKHELIASRIPSTGKEGRYPWLKALPSIREWLGDRVINNLSVNLQSLENKKYEGTFSIDREDFEDDLIGVYMPSVEELARQAKMWPEDLVVAALQAGDTTACHDGQFFFDTDHPIDPDGNVSGTQSNDFGSSALSPANYAAVRAAMMSMKREDGKPMDVVPNLLIVPPQLEATARQILNAEIIAAAVGGNAAQAQTNVYRGSADLLVMPKLANEPTVWYLADTRRAVKPLIFQDRLAPEFTMLNRPDDQNVFMQDKYIFGVRARGAAGYGPYYLISRSEA